MGKTPEEGYGPRWTYEPITLDTIHANQPEVLERIRGTNRKQGDGEKSVAVYKSEISWWSSRRRKTTEKGPETPSE